MTHFKFKPLVLAMAFAIPAGVQAQAPSDGIEEIVITGSFRDSLASALNQKRNATGAVDAIVADDIASFPDLNLAESMQRIPGVAITRAAGEGRQISVRGLGPDFTRVRINGMEAVATGGGTDAIGGANRGRGFDFNTFASELFSSLSVRKTASADVEEGSLGATVDMQAARPFDYDDFTFSASGQLGYNDLSEEANPRVSALVSNVFADGTVGALLSVSYSERDIRDEGSSTVRWANANPIGSYQGGDVPEEAQNAFRPRIPRYDSYNHNLERLGIAGSLQFRPTNDTEISLDGLYAKLDATRNEIFMQGILNNSPITGAMDMTAYEVDPLSNTLTYAQFENATVRSENRFDEMSTEFTQVTLNVEHDFSDRLRMNALLGISQSDFSNPIQTTIVAQKSGIDFGYDYRGGNARDPILSFGEEVQDLSGWETNSVRLRPLGAENTYTTGGFDLEYDLNDVWTLKGGLLYKNFEFETHEARRASEDAGGVELDDFMMAYDSELGANNPWAVPNLDAIAQQYNIYSNQGEFEVSRENRAADNYTAEEESVGVFAQMVFDTRIGDTPFRGDFGIRHVETDQNSTALGTLGGSVEQLNASHSYSNTLPSINLVFEPIDDVLVRLGYAEVMARAGLGSITPGVSVGVSGANLTVGSGNPTLEPTRAKTYDVGVEMYFDNESMLGVALFHKSIDSHIQTLRQTAPLTELPDILNLGNLGASDIVDIATRACDAGPDGYGAGCNENADWNYNIPLNGPGGDLYGFELSYQQPFTFLPGMWSNLGYMGNFTFVHSEMDYLNADGSVATTRPLLGLSDETWSNTLYYEDNAFSTRVSAAYRSGYLTNPTGRNGNDREGTAATLNIDLSMSYQVNDNVKLSFEALNLTDEADDQWVDATGNRLSYYHQTGRQYYVGVQYRY